MYSHCNIAWIKAYLLCLGERRPMSLLRPRYTRQLELFNENGKVN